MAESCGDYVGSSQINLIVDDPHFYWNFVDDGQVKMHLFFKRKSVPVIIQLLRKLNTYICINENSHKNMNYLRLIKDVAGLWNQKLKKEPIEIAGIFDMKFLLLRCKHLPEEISSLGCEISILTLSEDLTSENFKHLLISEISRRKKQVERALSYQGPWLTVKIKHSNVDAICKEVNLLSSKLRGHFEMAFIPNVQCRKHKGEKAIIEIRPCSSKQCLKLLCLLKDNFLQQCLKEDDIKEPKIDNVQETLQHFFPTIRKHDIKLNKYIQKGALEEVIKLVQECLAEEKAPLHEQNEQSNIVLELCNDDQLGLFKMLPEDKEDLCKTERQGCNLLHLAVMHDKKAVIAMIFYAGFWPELRSGIVELDGKYFGYTPRRIAEDLSINGNSSVLEIFDYYDECYSNLPLLHRACLRGSLCFAHYLINERCHKIIEKDKVNEATCLTYARASGNKDLVQYLLKKGANHAINDKMNTFHNSQITDILHDCIDQ